MRCSACCPLVLLSSSSNTGCCCCGCCCCWCWWCCCCCCGCSCPLLASAADTASPPIGRLIRGPALLPQLPPLMWLLPWNEVAGAVFGRAWALLCEAVAARAPPGEERSGITCARVCVRARICIFACVPVGRGPVPGPAHMFERTKARGKGPVLCTTPPVLCTPWPINPPAAAALNRGPLHLTDRLDCWQRGRGWRQQGVQAVGGGRPLGPGIGSPAGSKRRREGKYVGTLHSPILYCWARHWKGLHPVPPCPCPTWMQTQRLWSYMGRRCTALTCHAASIPMSSICSRSGGRGSLLVLENLREARRLVFADRPPTLAGADVCCLPGEDGAAPAAPAAAAPAAAAAAASGRANVTEALWGRPPMILPAFGSAMPAARGVSSCAYACACV